MNDGRNIDASLGTMSGEGASQRVSGEWPAPRTGHTPSEHATSGDATYYNNPVIKKSPWSWDIPAYYYVGGASGGMMALGAAATLLNREALSGLIAKSRFAGTAGAGVSAVLLIHDLGRPARFLHMLRVFRPTSPMSIGTWILISFSSLTGFAALTELTAPRFRRLGDVAAALGGVFGLALSGYTGVLVANTVVPVWHQPHRLMPTLFLASGAASAASLFDVMGGSTPELRATRVFGIAGKAVECISAALIDREVGIVPEVARPLQEGFSGMLWQAGKIISAASLGLSLVPRPTRAVERVAGILGTVGALCIRFGIHYAGQRSATNPRATFHQQRQGHGAFKVTGTAAITGPEGQRAYTGAARS